MIGSKKSGKAVPIDGDQIGSEGKDQRLCQALRTKPPETRIKHERSRKCKRKGEKDEVK